jgi:hypothetical protein
MKQLLNKQIVYRVKETHTDWAIAAASHKIYIKRDFDGLYTDDDFQEFMGRVKRWCNQQFGQEFATYSNPSGVWYYGMFLLVFKHAEHAMLFKLMWAK